MPATTDLKTLAWVEAGVQSFMSALQFLAWNRHSHTLHQARVPTNGHLFIHRILATCTAPLIR
jgi:hypothetical protein